MPLRPNVNRAREAHDLELMERLLAAMEVGVGAFTSCDVRRGYDLTFDASSRATVHYCMAGNGELIVINGSSFEIRKHTFVLLPPGLFTAWDRLETNPKVLPGVAGFELRSLSRACQRSKPAKARLES